MKVYVTLLVLLVVGNLYGQNVLGTQSKSMDTNPLALGFIRETTADTKEIKGNTYLYEQWFSGTLNFINGSKLADKSIRYNLQSNIFEILIDGVRKVAEHKFVQSFTIFNQLTLQTEKYVNASTLNNTSGPKFLGFLRELHTGSYTLYSRTEVKLVQGKYVSALDMGDQDDYYTRKVVYFVMKDMNLVEISLNKKQFADSFSEYEQKILDYVKENNLSLKKENDLVAVISYLNSLSV